MTNNEIADKIALQLLSDEPAAMLLGLELLTQQEQWLHYWEYYLRKLYERAWDIIYYETEDDHGIDWTAFYSFSYIKQDGLRIGCFEVTPTTRECADDRNGYTELSDNYFFSFYLGKCTMRLYIFGNHYEQTKVEDDQSNLHDFQYRLAADPWEQAYVVLDGTLYHENSSIHKLMINRLKIELKKKIHDKP
jgi:hypothetical protein